MEGMRMTKRTSAGVRIKIHTSKPGLASLWLKKHPFKASIIFAAIALPLGIIGKALSIWLY